MHLKKILLVPGTFNAVDGESNTTLITAFYAPPASQSYAAAACANYSIDSQGNSPCAGGAICYNDWFLPATDQLTCMLTNKNEIGNFDTGDYWTSVQLSATNAQQINSDTLVSSTALKQNGNRVRCARTF